MFHLTLNLIDATMAIIVVDLVVITHAFPNSLTRNVTIAAFGGGWLGLAVFLGGSGQLAFSPNSPVPVIGILFVTPLFVFGVLALTKERCGPL